jgi:molecular chaperone HtpG
MSKGSINVSVENIFPLIKKFLYSDHEIFLRELISNGTDSTTKLKNLISIGEAKVELGDAKIDISIEKDNKTVTIKDNGLGMTGDEVEKYINQIAFSGAEEFLEKYKDDKNDTGVIGHFGLGFYSAFMVAEKVDIITKSFKEGTTAVKWTCDGSPEYTLVEDKKTDRGTEIVLHIAEDSLDFLEDSKISGLLNKYNRFNQVPIKFGNKQVNDPDFTPATTTDKDGKENLWLYY